MKPRIKVIQIVFKLLVYSNCFDNSNRCCKLFPDVYLFKVNNENTETMWNLFTVNDLDMVLFR